MENVLGWAKGIAGCLIVMSLALQCVPGKKYRPYLRLFLGIVLILTIVAPLSEFLGFSGALETLTGELAYREEDSDWVEKLMEGEDWAKEQIIAAAQEMSREAQDSDGQEKEDGKSPNKQGKDGAAEAAARIQVEVNVQEVPPVVISGEESE